MALIPLGISLVSQSAIVLLIPITDPIIGCKFIIREFILKNPGSRKIVCVAIEPTQPDSFLIIVFISRVKIVCCPNSRITVLEVQGPYIPANE
jgi:hypothetical protein